MAWDEAQLKLDIACLFLDWRLDPEDPLSTDLQSEDRRTDSDERDRVLSVVDSQVFWRTSDLARISEVHAKVVGKVLSKLADWTCVESSVARVKCRGWFNQSLFWQMFDGKNEVLPADGRGLTARQISSRLFDAGWTKTQIRTKDDRDRNVYTRPRQ